jgi:hypothetical protein
MSISIKGMERVLGHVAPVAVLGWLLSACGASTDEPSPGEVRDALSEGEYYYLRCNATGWAVDDRSRLEPSYEERVYTRTFEVTDPALVQNGDQCSLTRTNQYNGWGTQQTHYGIPSVAAPLEVPGEATYIESTAPFAVRYPATGKYRARVSSKFASLELVPAGSIAFDVTGETLMAAHESASAFSDWDQDGDLDLLITGAVGSQCVPGVGCWSITGIAAYQNDQGSFADVTLPGAPLLAVHGGDLKWADYDHDGRPDLYLSGIRGAASAAWLNRIYHNTEAGFEVVYDHPAQGLARGEGDWADYDLDGDVDLVYCGENVLGQPATVLLENQGGAFVPHLSAFEALTRCAVSWGDYDSDGDPDLFLAGQSHAVGDVTRVYRNDGGQLVDVGGTFPGVRDGHGAWGDFDGDGDLDLAIVGESFSVVDGSWSAYAEIYQNSSGSLVRHPFEAGVGYARGDVLWADADNDGDLDLFAMGIDSSGFEPALARWYENVSGTFSGERFVALPGLGYGDADTADFDGDGDLDLLLTGARFEPFQRETVLYRNVGAALSLPLP